MVKSTMSPGSWWFLWEVVTRLSVVIVMTSLSFSKISENTLFRTGVEHPPGPLKEAL